MITGVASGGPNPPVKPRRLESTRGRRAHSHLGPRDGMTGMDYVFASSRATLRIKGAPGEKRSMRCSGWYKGCSRKKNPLRSRKKTPLGGVFSGHLTNGRVERSGAQRGVFFWTPKEFRENREFVRCPEKNPPFRTTPLDPAIR